MPDITLEDVNTSAQNAMKAFEAMKTEVLPLKKKFEDLDGETKGQFSKMEKAINDAIEASQKEAAKEAARVKTLEDQNKTLSGELDAVKTAMNRVGSGDTGDQSKKIALKRKELFNAWSKKRNENKEEFASYLERVVTDVEERKALTTGSDPNGGYLVMPEMGGVIQTRIFESSPIRQLATVTTVGTDQYELILDNDEAAAGWVGESSARSATNTPTLGKLIIPVNEIYANPKASQKMLDDGIVDVEAWLSGKVADQFARTQATAFVSGNGVLKPKGLLSYTAGTTIASQQVEQIVTQDASNFTYPGLVNLQNELKEGYQNNAVFLIQRASNANLMTILDGQGRPIFNMTYDKNVGLTPTIMGKPVYFASDMPTITTNALSMIYGDIRQAYQILDRTGVRVLRDPYTDKPNVSFYTTQRVGGAVVNFEAYKIGKIST